MSNFPKGWITAKLEEITKMPKSDIVDGPFGSNLKADEYKSKGIPLIRLQNIDRNQFLDKNTRFIASEKAELLKRHSFVKGDIVVTKLGVPVGKACIVPNHIERGIIVADVVRVRVDEENVSKKFVVFAINSPTVITQINSFVKGSTRPRVNLSHIRSLEIPLPPLNEQKRIVAKLEALLSRVDASKERFEKIPKILKRFRQSVLAAACSGKLTADWRAKNGNGKDGEDLPFGWKMVQLKDYAKCSRGRFSIRPRNDPAYFNGKYPFIQIGNIPSFGGLITSHNQTLNEMGLAVSKMFPKGTVVIAIVGATIGNTGILGYDMCFTDSMVGIETGTETGNKFVEFYLRHKRDEIRESSYAGGGQPNIKLETLNPYPLPLPPLPEQKEIVRRVEDLFKFADSIEERFKQAKAQVDKLTNSILAKAFRGELVGQDDTDEPASVLLERIKTGNETNQANPKTKRKAVNQGNLF